MKKVYLLILRHKKLAGISVQTVEESFMIFEKIEDLETWLRNNGFLYGQCNHFVNKSDIFYWFHQNDFPIDYIEVEIQKHEIRK